MSEIEILKSVHKDYMDGKAFKDKHITVRDHFAGLAMQVAWEHIKHIETLAKQSYEIADAMIAERDKR